MKKWGKRAIIFVCIVLAYAGFKRLSHEAEKNAKAIGVLEVEGTMWFSDDWLEQIEKLRKDPRVKAVVVRIQSPGGTVASAEEIYTALQNLSKTKPVVASMGTIAASGGLYVAMGANKIMADRGTITGSIGVRMEHINIEDLLKFLKIQYETIKSGQFKDMAAFNRPLGTEERALLDDMMKEIHLQFKQVVATSRNIPLEKVDGFADGRIFSGAKAKELGLVDAIGNFNDAVALAANLAKISGEPELIYPKEKKWSLIRGLMGTTRAAISGPLACFMYP